MFSLLSAPPHHTPFLLDKCKERWDEIDVGQLHFTTNIMELVRACLASPSSLWTFPCNVLAAHSLVFAKVVKEAESPYPVPTWVNQYLHWYHGKPNFFGLLLNIIGIPSLD